MMEYSALNIFVRQIVNGTMALSALLLLFVFVRYVLHHLTSIRRSGTVQAAAAISVLMAGHFMRASSSWIEFILLDLGVDTTMWLQWTWVFFMLAFVGIFIGKILMINTFAPRGWRKTLVYVGMPITAIIPFLIAVVLRNV